MSSDIKLPEPDEAAAWDAAAWRAELMRLADTHWLTSVRARPAARAAIAAHADVAGMHWRAAGRLRDTARPVATQAPPAPDSRAAFEALMSGVGRWAHFVQRDAAGNYVAAQTHHGWGIWQAAVTWAASTQAPAADAQAGAQLADAIDAYAERTRGTGGHDR